jgi:hypothetical protein
VDIKWKKSRDGKAVTAVAGPLSIELSQTGDGRWSWQVKKDGTQNPMASGVAGSLGAAKTVTAQLVNRSGFV